MPASPTNSRNTYRFTDGSDRTKVSFELNANKPYIPVRINDTGPFWFILDSGADSNIVDTQTAKALGIPLKDPWESRGGGEETVTSAVGSNVSLGVGSLELHHAEIDVVPVNAAISSAEGRIVNGLLGYDFFKLFMIEVDYMQHQVSIQEPKEFQPHSKAVAIPIQIIRGSILASAAVTMSQRCILGSFLIDTAWRSALTFTSPFVAAEKLLQSVSSKVDSITGMGIGGTTVDTLARVPALELEQYSIENILANFSHAKAGVLSQEDFSGIIGAEILRKFKVTFDYAQYRMILEPNATFAEPLEFDMAGLFITSEGEDLRKFRIGYVIEDSPAAQAGVRVGDEIETIDDRPASAFSLEQVRVMFKEGEGREHSIGITRGAQRFRVSLTLKRII